MGKINWDEETSRKLLTILLDEKERGRNKTNWNSIAKNLNGRTNGDATAKQVQNHASVLKIQLKTYEELSRLSGVSFNSNTGAVDVEERCLDRWKTFLQNDKKYGTQIAKKGLANKDLLERVFGGTTAHGVGGCFSPAMARGDSYLSKRIDNLVINEEPRCEGDSEDSDVGINLNLPSGAAESVSPPKSMKQKVCTSSRSKRKSEDTIESSELKPRQTSFDAVIQLLTSSVGVGSSRGVSKAQLVSDALSKMEVVEKKGDELFVKASIFLSEEKRADCFLALLNDNQKWIYLKQIDEI